MKEGPEGGEGRLLRLGAVELAAPVGRAPGSISAGLKPTGPLCAARAPSLHVQLTLPPSMLPRPGPLKAWVLLCLSSVGPFFPPLLPLYPANSYSFFKAHQL